MIKDEGSSFETQLKIDFSPPNNGSKICLEKYLLVVAEQPYMEQIPSLKKKKKIQGGHFLCFQINFRLW